MLQEFDFIGNYKNQYRDRIWTKLTSDECSI